MDNEPVTEDDLVLIPNSLEGIERKLAEVEARIEAGGPGLKVQARVLREALERRQQQGQ